MPSIIFENHYSGKFSIRDRTAFGLIIKDLYGILNLYKMANPLLERICHFFCPVAD